MYVFTGDYPILLIILEHLCVEGYSMDKMTGGNFGQKNDFTPFFSGKKVSWNGPSIIGKIHFF